MDWQDISTADAVVLLNGEFVGRPSPVLLFNEKTGGMRVGAVHEYLGSDGIIRRGLPFGISGIWVASHWMPLPPPPTEDTE